MQEIQTALDILSLLPIATAAILLLAHLWGCWQRTAPSQPHQMEQDATTTVEVEEPEVLVSEVYRRTEENSESEPAIAVQSPVDPNTLNSHQLRNLCKELGIRWRNVKGQGKHMTRLEMLNALGRAIA